MRSISARLLISTGLVLAIFVVLTALSVSYSVHQRAETALFDRLQGLVYGILGAAEIDDGARLIVNDAALPDNRLNQPTTGLYAEIIDNNGDTLWQSASNTLVMPEVRYAPVGEWVFDHIDAGQNKGARQLYMTTIWELDNGDELPFIVHVVADATNLAGQLRRFDRTLWVSLLASAACLLLVQLWVLSRSLQPLKQIGSELGDIEFGQRESLSEDVPRELAPLAHSINTLLVSERNRHRQYRHLLDDLAHSLKTPLSVLRNITHTPPDSLPTDSSGDGYKQHTNAMIDEQTQQMQKTLERYLQRAAMRTPQYLAAPMSPVPVLQRLTKTLSKVFAHQSPVQFNVTVNPDFMVRLSDVDLYEIFGNVLENACKYGASVVDIQASDDERTLVVDDNGPGFPDGLLQRLTERGVRADTHIEGQGLGLAASRELLQSYGGELSLGKSPTSGARVVLKFP